MIKDVLKFIVFFTLFVLVSYQVHNYFLKQNQIQLSFSLKEMYAFHAIVSLGICIKIRVLSSFKSCFAQLGFLYLATFFIKLILFALFFYNPVFTSMHFEIQEKIALLIPLFIFLFTEAVFVVNIINKKS